EALARKVRHLLGNQAQLRVPRAIAGAAPPRAAASPPAGGLTVVVVDDDELIREATAEMVAALGHPALSARNAADALEALAGSTADVLLTDLGLPDVSGAELARRALERWPHLRVVFTSGDDVAAQAGGMTAATLQKPYTSRDVAVVLDEVRNGVGGGLTG